MPPGCTDAPAFRPRIPVQLQIRRAIHDNYNDEGEAFNSDGILEILKEGGDIDPGWEAGDLEPAIRELCDSGAARSVGQNLSTVWLRLFERLDGSRCGSCGNDAFLAPSEDRVCPGCGSGL